MTDLIYWFDKPELTMVGKKENFCNYPKQKRPQLYKTYLYSQSLLGANQSSVSVNSQSVLISIFFKVSLYSIYIFFKHFSDLMLVVLIFVETERQLS